MYAYIVNNYVSGVCTTKYVWLHVTQYLFYLYF